jgi:hypothetical protein
MSKAKYIPEEILLSIQKLPQDSLGELVNFIEYLQFKNSSKPNQDNQNYQEAEVNLTTKITSEESEQIIEEILTEVGEEIPSLSDYAVSRAGIYEDHP